MSTYYSILFAPIRPNLSEQLSIGLMLKGEQGSYLAISNAKMSVVKELLPESAYKLLKVTVDNIISEYKISKSSQGLFGSNEVFDKLFSEKYLSYMSSYNNNLLTFTPATSIKLPCNNETFESLFRKFIDQAGLPVFQEKIEKEETAILNILKQTLYPKIEKRVNLEADLKMEDHPHLIVPMHLNFIGQNDKPVSGFAADFNKQKQHLQNDITKYISLKVSFETNNNPGKYFLIANEPNKNLFPDQHLIWKHLYDNGVLDIVPVNETDKIVEYLEEHGVKPYLA